MITQLLPRLSLGLLVFLLAPQTAFGQITEAALRGVVADATGNVLVAAPIVARHDETGQSRTATTDGDGAFLLAGLPPGSYTVTVRLDGFKTYERPALKLNGRERTAVEFARKLTRAPSEMTDGDYENLRSEFGEGGGRSKSCCKPAPSTS